MTNISTHKLVQGWIEEAATSLGFRRSGMAIWTRGADHKVVAAVVRSGFGNAYRLRLLVFFDSATKSVAASRADIDLHPVLPTAMSLFALELCLDFERPTPDLETRRTLVVSTLIAKVGPLMKQAGSREGLVKLIRQAGITEALPIWAREAIGLV